LEHMPGDETLTANDVVRASPVVKNFDAGISLWEVIGGKDKGGIIVREGQELVSSEAGRLSTGAVIQALEHPSPGGRLHYVLRNGSGPTSGWVSLSLAGKNLVVPASSEGVCPEESTASAIQFFLMVVATTSHKKT